MNGVVNSVIWVMYFVGLYFAIFWLYVFFERYEVFREESRASGSRRLSRYPKASVIIPAYNAAATIRDCVLSAVGLDYPRDKLEVIVVNDGSTDSTPAIVSGLIRSHKSTGIILMDQGNLGKGAAVNNGIKACSGEFFACLDADSFVEPETLRKMLCVFERSGPGLAIVTPAMKVFQPKGFIQKFQRVEYLVALLFNRIASHFDALYVAPGPFSLYRKSIMMKVGCFDERNLTEDLEIGYRMQKNNYGLKHCFDAYVYTTSPGTIPQLYRQRSRWWRGSILNFLDYRSLFLNPRYGHFGVFQLPVILLGYLTVFSVVFFFAHFVVVPWWKSFYDLYLTGFDLKTMFLSFRLSFDVLNYDIGKGFIIVAMLAAAVATFFFSHKSGREAIFRHGVIYLPFYFVFYYLLLSFIYVTAVLQLVFLGRRDKWLGKSI